MPFALWWCQLPYHALQQQSLLYVTPPGNERQDKLRTDGNVCNVLYQALLVEDLGNELDHTNLHFRQTTAELEYQKGLVERSTTATLHLFFARHGISFPVPVPPPPPPPPLSPLFPQPNMTSPTVSTTSAMPEA